VLFINGLTLLGWVKGTPASRGAAGSLRRPPAGHHAALSDLHGQRERGTDPWRIRTVPVRLHLPVRVHVRLLPLDWTGLGWFCFFVVLAAIAYGWFNWRNHTADGYVFAVEWWSWAFLWLLFWLVLSLGQWKLTRFTGAVCATQGIITGSSRPSYFSVSPRGRPKAWPSSSPSQGSC